MRFRSVGQIPAINTATTGSWNAALHPQRVYWTLNVQNAEGCTMAHIHEVGGVRR